MRIRWSIPLPGPVVLVPGPPRRRDGAGAGCGCFGLLLFVAGLAEIGHLIGLLP